MRFNDLSSMTLVAEQDSQTDVTKKVVGKNPKTGEEASFDVRRGDAVTKKTVTMYVLTNAGNETVHYIESPTENAV